MGQTKSIPDPQKTGEFNSHPNVGKCKLITADGKEIPWCNVLGWRWDFQPHVFEELEFTYKSGEINGKPQTDTLSIMFPYGNTLVFNQLKWNDRNCKC